MEDLALSPETDGPYDSSADEFYEQIEAPKFVDLTVKDPVRVDDRYWFCSRVGCDQKHEEELDSEEVYKSFVIRVMAARSPNVRLQKALSRRQAPVAKVKCPQSAPPKPTRPRSSRLALISSSITKKLADFKVRGGEHPPKISSTPVAKAKVKAEKSSVVAAKYMTTPRNRNPVPKVDSFRSVQNSKGACVAEAKSGVAKALVFHSPKKALKLKASLELKTPVRRACERLKKLEGDKESPMKRVLGYSPNSTISSRAKVTRPWHVSGSAKKCGDVKKVGTLMGKKRLGCGKLERAEGGTNCLLLKGSGRLKEMPADEFTEEPSSVFKTSELDDVNQVDGNLGELENKEVTQEAKGSDENQASRNLSESENVEVMKDAKGSDENQLSENLGELAEEKDDKENESAPDRNRYQSGRKALGSEETGKKIMKLARPATASKDAAAAAGAQVLLMCNSKPKFTNPKPFRLRTDERGVLKEARPEKKVRSFTSAHKNQNSLQIGKCQGNIESKPGGKKITKLQSKAVKEVKEKPGVSTAQKPSFASSSPAQRGNGDPASANKPEKPKSILLSSGKRKNLTPNRDDNVGRKPTVSFLIPGEKTPELSERLNEVPGGKSPSRERGRSQIPTMQSCPQKPKNCTWRLP